MKNSFLRTVLFLCVVFVVEATSSKQATFSTSSYYPSSTNDVLANFFEYGIVIDAGSSGNRVWVYKWPRDTPANQMMQIMSVSETKFKPRLNELQDDLLGLRTLLAGMVESAKSHTPRWLHNRTNIYFFATAGMRLVMEEKANDVFDHITELLSDVSFSPFRFDPGFSARILSGEEEGVFMWLTVNYLSGLFENDAGQQKTMGILELGGASTQIAFLPRGSLLANKFPLRLIGRRYPLYVHSYLYYGQEFVDKWIKDNLQDPEMMNDSVENPCMLKGDMEVTPEVTFIGTGDPEKCNGLLGELVYKIAPNKCFPKPCAIGPTYQPKIPPQMQFYVLGAFHLALRDLGVLNAQGRFNLSDAFEKASVFCSQNIEYLMMKHPEIKKAFLSKTCLAGLYTVKLFHRGYEFPMNTDQLIAVDQINEKAISWTMGALMYENKFQYKRRR